VNLYIYDIVIEAVPPATEPTLSLTSGSATQTLYAGVLLITPIVYTYGGTATSAAIAWSGTADASTPPAGITVTPDAVGKTLTIAGTPTTAGAYSYSVTSTDDVNTTAPLSGSITVNAVTQPLMAYVTTLGDVRDDVFVTAYEADFDVVKIASSATGVNYAPYDVIVLSAVPSSGDDGLAGLKAVSITKPFVNMKSYQLQASRWNWCVPANNTGVTTVTVPDGQKSHAIFSGITFTGANNDEIDLVGTTISGNGVVTFPTLLTDAAEPAPVTLATYNSGISYCEIPVGATPQGMSATTAKHIILGLSEAAWTSLTSSSNAVAIAVNAALYVTGQLTAISPITVDNQRGGAIDKIYYDLAGRPATKAAKGLLIEKSVYEDGSVSYGKVYVK
jgi:hypothetical protein